MSNWWFECVGAFFKQKLFGLFHVLFDCNLFEINISYGFGARNDKFTMPEASQNWYLFPYSRFAYFRPKSFAYSYKKKIIFGHQVMSNYISMSLKMCLGHVKVTSSAITGFVCTRAVVVESTYQWRCVGTVEVNQNKRTATELFITARSWSMLSSKSLESHSQRSKDTRTFWYKENYVKEYAQYLYILMYKYCSNVVLLLYCIFNTSFMFKILHKADFFTSRRNTTFCRSKVGETGVGEQGISRLPRGWS